MTHFQIKTAQKAAHTYIAYVGEYTPRTCPEPVSQ